MGVLKWVDWTVSEPRYFQLQTDHTPVHLALLDEVGAGGPTQRTVGPCSAPAGSTGKRRPVQPPGTRRPVPAPAGPAHPSVRSGDRCPLRAGSGGPTRVFRSGNSFHWL